MGDPLQVRLFGYGVPYRARWSEDGSVEPLPTDATREAADLAAELTALSGGGKGAAAEADTWAVSMPFGRCGVEDRPHEYLRAFNLAEGYLDVLTATGVDSVPLAAGEMVRIVPGAVVRLRARPAPGHRCLVAFQTEDRTPLSGNAAPFTLDGQVPDAYDQRLKVCHAAFAAVAALATDQRAASLQRFFATMAQGLSGNGDIARIQTQARAAGSYTSPDEDSLYQRQQALLSTDIIARIGAGDEALFRFPGMFGGITTLFNALPEGEMRGEKEEAR
ncbi:MAG: hypothetical protein GKR89_12000 [Candidatus Latescibacteria bacterium]|nr:hypothetical protein [Candidatus Latescibacterota bacterium]